MVRIVVPTTYCRTDLLDILLRDDYSNHPRLSIAHNVDHHEHQDDNGFVTYSYVSSQSMDETCFKRFVQELPFDVFRMKGTVQFRDRTAVVNHVGGKCELLEQTRISQTRLTFIGWNTTFTEI